MFLMAITGGLIGVYLLLLHSFPFLFGTPRAFVTSRIVLDLLGIFAVSLVGYIVAFSITDIFWSNRFLHGFGGGFMAVFVCYFAARQGLPQITKLQFASFAILIATTLGVGNEIMEFVLQHYGGIIFAEHVEDTWLDLVSNSIGIIIGIMLLTPFVPNAWAPHSFYGDTSGK